jgi:NDP-sugar pyrophosphorylase family protein
MINGGLLVVNAAVLNYIGANDTIESEPIERLAADNELHAYRATGSGMP